MTKWIKSTNWTTDQMVEDIQWVSRLIGGKAIIGNTTGRRVVDAWRRLKRFYGDCWGIEGYPPTSPLLQVSRSFRSFWLRLLLWLFRLVSCRFPVSNRFSAVLGISICWVYWFLPVWRKIADSSNLCRYANRPTRVVAVVTFDPSWS